jgi:hypothetical protein
MDWDPSESEQFLADFVSMQKQKQLQHRIVYMEGQAPYDAADLAGVCEAKLRGGELHFITWQPGQEQDWQVRPRSRVVRVVLQFTHAASVAAEIAAVCEAGRRARGFETH